MVVALGKIQFSIFIIFVNRVLPREVAQAAMVPTTLVSRSLVRDVDKELPRLYPFYLYAHQGWADP